MNLSYHRNQPHGEKRQERESPDASEVNGRGPTEHLVAENISKAFGGVEALRGAHFDLKRGEVHALVGENGAGKSTMIKVLCGLYSPDQGEIRLDGRHIAFDSPSAAMRHGIATIFQELTLMPYMTVAENLFLGWEPRNRFGLIRVSDLPELATETLQRYGVDDIDSRKLVENVSLPDKQKLEIVKNLARHPKIILMDEPTSSLAERDVVWLFRLTRILRDEGLGILFTSHRWKEVVDLADRITFFRNGEYVATHTVDAVDETKAIRLMTGRDVDVRFPELPKREPTPPALVVEDLVTNRLRDINFTIEHGEVLGVGGLAGQGQRELFTTLFGVDKPRKGRFGLNGRWLKLKSPADAIRAGIALIPEDRKTEGLILPLSVTTNLTLATLPTFTSAGFVRRRREAEAVKAMIHELGIVTSNAQQPVSSLSGGNQQKVLLGRWLLTDAEVILLYDVTRGVDLATKHDLYKLIVALSQAGKAILFYSSDTDEVANVSHRVIVMREGKIASVLEGDAKRPEAIIGVAIREESDVKKTIGTAVEE